MYNIYLETIITPMMAFFAVLQLCFNIVPLTLYIFEYLTGVELINKHIKW